MFDCFDDNNYVLPDGSTHVSTRKLNFKFQTSVVDYFQLCLCPACLKFDVLYTRDTGVNYTILCC